jgi:outer membrane protein OmpA-like peptidoglycan-associated protein
MSRTGSVGKAASPVLQAAAGIVLALLLFAAARPAGAAFDPPRIILVVNPSDAGRPTQGERTYYVDKGRDQQIDRGDILNVYREKQGVAGGPAVRFFIGTMTIRGAEPDLAMGHFTANEAALASPGIRYHTAMKSDIAVPVLVIEADVLFDAGQSSLKPAAAQEFQRVSDFIDEYQPGRLVIEGHTDTDGTAEAQQTLSEARAEAVRLYMIETFAAVTPAMIESRGYGGTRPAVPGDTPADKAQNRRIEVIVWE